MPTETTDDRKALALRTELDVVTSAIEVSMGVRELTVQFAARRAELIAAASEYEKPPTTDGEQESILTAQRALAALRIETVKQSEAFKAPLNAARKKIIEITDSGLASIEKEEKRLQGLVNHRQQLLMRERQEKEAAVVREAQRIAEEAAAAQRAQEDADRLRRAAEMAAAQAELLKGKAAERAREEAARLAAAATKAEEEAFERSLAAEAAPAPATEPVSDLPMAREVFDYTVIGENEYRQHDSLMKFAMAYLKLVKIEIRRRDLLDELNAGRITSAPGIEIHRTLTKLR